MIRALCVLLLLWLALVCVLAVACAPVPMTPTSSPVTDRYGWQPEPWQRWERT